MTNSSKPGSLTYASAGVDIEAGNALVENIKPLVARTHRTGILGAIGGFGGLFELPVSDYRQPVMVSGTDGVGTKLRLAIDLDMPDTVGIDLVAMCVNDILVCGAEPLWFLDYFASAKVDVKQASDGDYDLAGFAVGIVEKDQIIDGTTVLPGDQIIGIASNGPHSNGYSLIRKVLEQHDINAAFGDLSLGQTLMLPTRIYVKSILALLKSGITPKAMAHITGGGISENIPRSLPQNTTACIALNSWKPAPIFTWLQEQGNIEQAEMLRTFNYGIGYTLVVGAQEVDNTLAVLQASGEEAMVIGSIESGEGDATVSYA